MQRTRFSDMQRQYAQQNVFSGNVGSNVHGIRLLLIFDSFLSSVKETKKAPLPMWMIAARVFSGNSFSCPAKQSLTIPITLAD